MICVLSYNNGMENVYKETFVKSKRKRRAWLAILLCAAALVLGIMVAALLSLLWNRDIKVTKYEMRSEKTGTPIRIALISDLHRQKFDETNQLLVDRVKEQAPDLICVDGDMLEHHNTDEQIEELRFLFERLIGIAPVYFAAGNHDYDVYGEFAAKQDGEYLFIGPPSKELELLESTGAVFLEKEYTEVTVKGERLRIGGFYPLAYQMENESEFSFRDRESFLEDYCDTDSFKLMLSHRPDSYLKGGAMERWNIDLVVCGHTHGGVVRMPFGLGALWTNEGFFPKHDMGFFEEESLNMLITSGLDGHNGFPRVFNPPEIAVIDVLPEG